ncbi:unnamed protein product [Oreochromis niloticus]|nr:unnamed protein product [Mustela putorius furo]
MSAEVQAAADFRVKYSRRTHSNGREREYSEVQMIDDGEQHPDVGIQEADALNKSEFNKMKNSHTDLEDELQDTKTNLTQLQSSYDKLSKNHSQLQEEVKKLKEKIEEKRCSEGWRRFGSSCYFKSTESKTWSDSRRDCQDKGADLVMINSKEEQEFISKFGGYSWIGLEAKQSSGGYKWEWVDGSALTETFWGTGWSHVSSGFRGVCCDSDGRWTHSPGYNFGYHVSKIFICEK